MLLLILALAVRALTDDRNLTATLAGLSLLCGLAHLAQTYTDAPL